MITLADDQVHCGEDAGFADSVTLAWGDAERGLYGSARLGSASGRGSEVALLFAGGEVAASSVREEGAGEVQTVVEEPLAAWTTRFIGETGGWDLCFEALVAPLELGAGTAAADAAGLEGYEQLCRVRGKVTAAGRRVEVDCLGQRGHQWGAVDWKRIALSRSVSAWLAPDRGVTLAAVRPARAQTHADEAVTAWVVHPGDDAPVAELVADPRLSTLYDGEGRQRRAGLELWPEGDDVYPRRAAGEVVCGTSLELGALRLDSSFFSWRMDGAEGVGRYDVLRPSA